SAMVCPTTISTFFVDSPCLFWAVMVMLYFPCFLIAPLMTPNSVSNVQPAGNPDTVYFNGRSPVAAILYIISFPGLTPYTPTLFICGCLGGLGVKITYSAFRDAK